MLTFDVSHVRNTAYRIKKKQLHWYVIGCHVLRKKRCLLIIRKQRKYTIVLNLTAVAHAQPKWQCSGLIHVEENEIVPGCLYDTEGFLSKIDIDIGVTLILNYL